MQEENIVKVRGNWKTVQEVFTLDKATGLVTYTSFSRRKSLSSLWNETLQWLPVKSISNHLQASGKYNYLTLELTTGEVVRLCDKRAPTGRKTLRQGTEYLCIGLW